MKKRTILKTILIILTLITTLFLSFLGYQKFKPTNTTTSPIEKEILFNQEILTIDYCKHENDINCGYSDNSLKYTTLTKSYSKLNEAIKKINMTIKEKYNETINSSLDSEECKKVQDIYNYRNLYGMSETLYESNDIIGISYDISGIDVCTEQPLFPSFDSYIYSIKQNSLLTNQEILNLYQVSTNNIEEAIQKDINYWNQNLSTNYTIQDIDENYKLFISQKGDLNLIYLNKSRNTTYTVIIKKTNTN